MNTLRISLLILFRSLNIFGAVSFDATNDILGFGTCGDTMLKENGACSLSIWGYATSNGEGSAGSMFSRNNFNFRLDTNLGIRFNLAGSTALIRLSTTNQSILNGWHNYIMTWDGSTTAANCHIYLDGIEVSYSTTQNGVSPTDNSGNAVNIGNNQATSGTWGGLLDEPYVWTSVITATDIALLQSRNRGIGMMCSVKPNFYPSMEVAADGTTLTTVGSILDKSGNGYNGSPTNSPTAKAASCITGP